MVIQSGLYEINKAMRALRAQAGMTLQQASEASGLSVSFISDMERGRSDPSLGTVRKLTEVYQCNAVVVFTSTA